jgi:hypothetical protein
MADTWHVTNQRQTTALSSGGTFQDVMEVTFETTSGTTGSVRIPVATYSAQAVSDAINARVAQIDAVHSL